MSLSLLASSALAGPLLVAAVEPDAVHEKVASVYLPDCMRLVAEMAEQARLDLQKAVQAADTEARERLDDVDEARGEADQDGTELNRIKASLAALEFESFRKRTQNRLRKLERQMMNRWLQRVQAAVKVVAERDGYSIVLYERNREMEKPLEDVELQIKDLRHAVPVAAYVSDESRVDITDDVLEVMRAAATEESKDDATAVPAAAE